MLTYAGVGDNADGANGVIVNSDPMAPQTQMRVNPSTTPRMYTAEDGQLKPGHPGLTRTQVA